MKRVSVITGILVLAALAFWAYPSVSKAAFSLFTENDPDVPRTWKNAMSKEEYMLRRNEHIALMRGIGTGVPLNPALRMQAIEQLEQQECA